MSELKDHLIVHYPLADTTKVNRVIGSNAEIIFSNTVTQVTDQHFSKVLQAPDKGDHAIKITGIDLHKTYEQQKQLSFSFWLHFGKRVTKHISILQLGLSGSSDLKAFINCEPDPSEGTLFTADLQYKSKSHYKTLQLSGWTHVTLVYTATQATFWINGEVGLQQSITGNPFLSNSAIWLLPYISQNVLITQFRLYNCTLTAENIYTIQQEDLGKSGLDLLPKIPEGPRPSIFHFSLEDQNHQPHLYIKNQNAQLSDSYLTITNKTDTPLLFQQLTLQNHAPTADQCHLELRFRPGTLKLDDTTHPIQLNDANTTWVMSAADVHQDSYVSFYFAHKDSFVINAQASMKLAIQNLHAQIGHDGARGTRIEIRYHNIYITDNQGKHSLLSESLSGYLQQAINVVNQLGVQNESLKPTGLPFHVGFLGSNTILNDGSADNTLILKITNNRDHDIVFKQATNPASDFMLSFDQGEMDWAVGTMDEINEVEIQVITATQADQLNTLEAILAKREAVQGQSSFDTNGKLMEEVFDYTDWKVIKNEEDAITTWTLHRQHDDLSIAPEHSIFIVISKLISSTPDGTGNLYLDYHDLGKGDHSYADGRYTVSIQKSPIVYRGQHVGIGTNTPNAKLQVAGGDVRVDFGNLIVDKGAVSSKYIGLKNVISGEMSDYVFAGMLSAQQYLVFQGKTPEEPFQLFQLTEERQLKALSITEYITPDVYYTAPFISNDALYGLGSDNSYAYQNDPSNRPFYLFKYDLQHKTKTKTRVTNPLKWDNRPCVQAWKYGQKLYLFFYDRALNNSPSDKELGYIDLNTHTYMSLFKDSAIEMNLLPQVYQDATPSFLYFKIRRWQNPQEPHDKWIMVDLNSSEKTEVTAAQLSKNIQKDINGTVNLTHEHNGFKLFFTGNLVMYPYTLHDVQQPSKFITVNTTPAMPTNDQAGYATFFYKDKYINFLNGRLIITSIQNPVRPTIIVDTERQGVKADAEFSKVMQTGPKILAVNDDYIFMIEDSFDPKDVYIVDMHQNGSAFSYQKIRISHNSTITSIVLLPHISNLTFCTLLYPSGFEYYTDIEIHKGNRTEINENISTTGRYFDKTGTLIPVGAILPYAGQVAPRGWLLCDGTMLFKSDSKFYLFEDLIQLIGTTYGGDGQNTWQLPDLRSLFPIGAGQGQGFSDYQVSKTGGQERVALDPKEMPPHTHSIIHTHMSQDDGHYHKIITNNGTGNDGGIDDATKVSSSGTSDSKTEVEYAKVTIFPNDGKYHKTIGNDRSYYENISRSGNAGGEESKPEQYNEHGQKTDAGEFQVQSHENMPPYIALNYIIKL